MEAIFYLIFSAITGVDIDERTITAPFIVTFAHLFALI
jgi:hypothetical protein